MVNYGCCGGNLANREANNECVHKAEVVTVLCEDKHVMRQLNRLD